MSRSTSPSMDSSDEAPNMLTAADSSEEWLDGICLEPLVSPEPGYARLCNACKRVFCVHPGDESANHIQNLDTLEWSAQRGCVLCALILYKIEWKDPSYRQSPRQNIGYKVGFPFRDETELVVTFSCYRFTTGVLMLPLGNYVDPIWRKYALTCVH